MGIWKDDVNYSTYYDDLRIPMVFYDDRDWNSALNTYGSYYFFNEELESEYIEIYSRDDNGTNFSYLFHSLAFFISQFASSEIPSPVFAETKSISISGLRIRAYSVTFSTSKSK